MQQKTITTTLLFIFPFRRTIGQIAQRVRVYYTTTHTNKRVGIYCVVRHCLVGKRFIIPLLKQQQKAKAEEEEEEAIGVVDVSGLLELFLYVFKAMACCLADVPPRIYTGMYSSSSRRREAFYVLHSVFNLRPRGCCVFEWCDSLYNSVWALLLPAGRCTAVV